jgi:hypothetical protein
MGYDYAEHVDVYKNEQGYCVVFAEATEFAPGHYAYQFNRDCSDSEFSLVEPDHDFGERINWEDLPEEGQAVIRDEYEWFLANRPDPDCSRFFKSMQP